MRLTLPALVLGLLVAQGAMAAGDGTAALGGGLGGALGNVVGQKLGGSTGATIGAGVAGAAGGAAGAHKGNRTKAAIGGGVGAAGGSVIGRSLGGKNGATIGAGLGGAAAATGAGAAVAGAAAHMASTRTSAPARPLAQLVDVVTGDTYELTSARATVGLTRTVAGVAASTMGEPLPPPAATF